MIIILELFLLSKCHVLEENPERERLIRVDDETYSSCKPKAAISTYQKALSENPDNLELHLKLGKFSQDVDKLETTRKVFEQVLTIDGEDKSKKN